MISVQLKGMRELHDQLKNLRDQALAAKMLAAAARKAFKPVLEDARAHVPVDTGLLRDSIRLTVKRPQKGDTNVVVGLRVAVGRGGGAKDLRKLEKGSTERQLAWRKSAHWRWHFVELGTSKMAARPSFQPALFKNRAVVLDLFKQELAKAIQRTLRRQAKAKAAA